MSSVATAMLVDMVGEAGGLQHAVPVGGAVLGVLLGGVARLCCSCGLMSDPVAISNIDGVRGFVRLGVDPTALGVPFWDVPTAALVTSMSWAPATLAMLAYSRFVGDGCIGASALGGDGRCGLTLALRVNAKLGTLSLAEGILLPRVHDELGGSQQTLQRRLGRIGRILLEGLLQIALEQSVGAIILARVMEVSEDLFESASMLP